MPNTESCIDLQSLISCYAPRNPCHKALTENLCKWTDWNRLSRPNLAVGSFPNNKQWNIAIHGQKTEKDRKLAECSLNWSSETKAIVVRLNIIVKTFASCSVFSQKRLQWRSRDDQEARKVAEFKPQSSTFRCAFVGKVGPKIFHLAMENSGKIVRVYLPLFSFVEFRRRRVKAG